MPRNPRPKLTHKICRVCNIDKPVADFPNHSSKCLLCVTGPKSRVRTHRICHTCYIDKPVSEYNGTAVKCKECVVNVPGRGDMKRKAKKGIVKCERCGEMKEYRAKGLCNACWQAARLERLMSDPSYYQPIEHKICIKCKVDKPASEFAKTHLTPDRLQAWCNDCRHQHEKELRQDPEWVALNQKRQRDLFNARDVQSKREIHDRNYGREKERKATEPEYRKKKNFQTTRKNLRRKKLIEAGAQHTLEEWEALCVKHEHKCLWCKKAKPLSEDHVLPLTMGGADTIDNIQPLCVSCNSRKNNRHMDFRPKV